MEIINYEDFKKLDIRVGTVLESEKVEKSDKLLKFKLDVGKKNPIQILSGISKYYSPESLIGKQLLVLVNLAPRSMMGFESQGMVLAALDGDTVFLVQPEKLITAGSPVS
ncbi:methionine--tRNA ligase subunit beta [bacterium]|nr:methionine--tRNA ligase subunit beta [bacterium]